MQQPFKTQGTEFAKGNRLPSPRDCPLADLSAPPSSPCASFRDPLPVGFGVNLTAAGLRQGTFRGINDDSLRAAPHLFHGCL
jgi:hypothetical protein